MGKNVNGAKRGRDDLRTPKPIVDVVPTEVELVAFMKTLDSIKYLHTKPCVQLMRSRVNLRADVRLAVNLKSLLGCLCEHGSIHNVLESGLSPIERQALLDLEDANLDYTDLAIAHSLLNIKERQELSLSLSKAFAELPQYTFLELNLE